MTFPAHDSPPDKPDTSPHQDNPNPVPGTEATETTPQAEQDAGMYAAGLPGAVERRLIHVDRVTEETLVILRQSARTQLATVAMVAIVGAMVWLLAREVRVTLAAFDD